jgi:hypothetical protein
MDRREILKISSVVLGYTLVGGSAMALLNGCKADKSPDWVPKTLNDDQVNLLAELCETILPKTDTPGAKDALCHRYIDELLTNFYLKEEQMKLMEELNIFDDKSKLKYSKAFVALTPGERESILETIVSEINNKKETDGKKHIFTAIKEATISGYFTSEIGAKGGLGTFIPVPGPYKGCIDYSTVGKVYVL